MKLPGGGRRRAPGARPTKGARPSPTTRPPDAALGRETRNLVGSGRGGAGAGVGRRAASSAKRTGPGLPRLGLASLRLPNLGLKGLVPGRGRRRLAVPRLGRIVTPARAGGLLGMLAAGFLYLFVSGPTAFGLTATELPALRWTDPAVVREALALRDGANVFRLDTGPLEAALEALPAVADADVQVELPDATVVVAIREREAILAWEAGGTRYLADRDGVLFAAMPLDATLPAGVAVVEDRRLDAGGRFAVGDRLDAVDLDVATRLGSLTPADVGSAASRLRVRVLEGDGFVLVVDRGWVAVFGFYSPATRPTDMIPGQVRLLRSLLAGREETLAKIILASETDGTYIPKATPRPTPR